MTRKVAIVSVVGLCLLIAVQTPWAQETKPKFKVEDNPFNDEFSYRIPNVVHPNIQIGNIRWTAMSLTPKSGKAIEAGETYKTILDLEIENTGEEDVKILFVALLYSDTGQQLERLETTTFKLDAGKTEEFKEKYKIDGESLKNTAKVWILFEIVDE